MRSIPIVVAVFLGFILAMAATARAQDTTLSGTVTDATDAALPGVTVTALLVDTGNTFVAVTDASGSYRIGAMRPGVYKITAELAGFTTVTRENVQLLVGQAASLALKMTLATVRETVTVTGEAPLISTSRSTLGGNIDPVQMEALPVNGRNWMQLTLLAPGSRANEADQSPTGLGPGGSGALRTSGGYFQLAVDGQQVTNLMSTTYYGQPRYARDAIEEFQFVSGRWDATQGRALNVIVNAVTKSGTNTVSGSGYGYFRNDKFIAADFVAKRVLPYSDQQLGFTLGGPLIKDKMHLFGYYEVEREPTTLAFTSRYPLFNIADFHTTRVEQMAGVRMDRQLGQRLRLMVRANGWKNELPIDPFGFNSATGHPSTNYSRHYHNSQFFGALTKMFGAKTINEFKPGWHLTSSDQFALAGLETSPQISLAGYSIGKQSSFPLRLYPHIWSIRDDLTTLWGRHEVKMGADYTYNHNFLEWQFNRYGLLQANGGPVPQNIQDLFPMWNDPSTWNLAPLAPISVRYTQSFATCSPVTGGCGYGVVDPNHELATWFQDNWAVSKRLMLNLGMRWDYAYNWAGQQFEFLPLRHTAKNDLSNFGPRLGMAYTLPGGRTVLRGGWGKYFMGVKDTWGQVLRENLQFTSVAVLNDRRPDFAVNPFNGAITSYEQAVNSGIIRDVAVAVVSDTARMPYSYQASMGFQRQLGETMAVQADYTWNGGRREEFQPNTNLSYDPATGVNYPFSDVSKRTWPYLGITGQYFSRGQSNYHGLEMAFSKRLSHHWQASGTYTLSRFRDYVPGPVSGATFITFPVAADIGNNWAYAVGDQRHRAVGNIVWELPYNFLVSAVYQYGSGQQYGSNWGTDLRNSGNAFNRLRPNGTIVPRDNLYGTPIHRADLRVLRTFGLQKSVKLEGTLEVFNLFNHANYASFVIAEVSPLYGQPQINRNTTYQPRLLQLGFRVTF